MDILKDYGGHHQLFSPEQSTVNASAASEPGFQQRLSNLSNLSNLKTGQRNADPIGHPTEQNLLGPKTNQS